LKISPESRPHLAEIEWHGFATIDLLDTVVDVLDQLFATPQQVHRVVESFVTIVIDAGGYGTSEKLLVLGRQAATHGEPFGVQESGDNVSKYTGVHF